MPRMIDPTKRETIELHAPWWSDAVVDVETPIPYLVGTPAKGDDTDDEEDGDEGEADMFAAAQAQKYDWERRSSRTRYVEHVTIYATWLEIDEEAISERMMAGFKWKKQKAKPDMKAIAKTRRYTLQQMIVEMTDEIGQQQNVHDERLVPEGKDAEYIMEAIAFLKQGPVTVLKSDRDRAALNIRNGHEGDAQTQAQLVAESSFRQ